MDPGPTGHRGSQNWGAWYNSEYNSAMNTHELYNCTNSPSYMTSAGLVVVDSSSPCPALGPHFALKHYDSYTYGNSANIPRKVVRYMQSSYHSLHYMQSSVSFTALYSKFRIIHCVMCKVSAVLVPSGVRLEEGAGLLRVQEALAAACTLHIKQ